MLTIDLDDFMFELQDGAIKHVGPSTRSATVKLYDTESVGVREYGDKRVKLSVADDEGNEIEIAMFPEQIATLTEEIDRLRDDSPVFE
ncbi:hypothetical protein [Halapricum salinum]|jgi:hypothetical protein|uniref:Uncharacterized protein n=1 Tax=Halapricum salinum TaxID=1457250 RepID=A0A4D6H7C2_9EURY|nr:hypothetical protein [Halapricum salinum]QCC49824.1 hypothetical protein DV733_00665 [Halapricum salinum]